MRRRLLAVTALAAACVAGAGLGLAQETGGNTVQDSATTPPSAPPPPPEAPQAPPPEDVGPPPEPAPPAPAEPSEPPAAPAANTVAQQPATPPTPPPPPKRPRYGVAVLQALDKVTAETLRFEAKANEPVRYKDLVITVHACETQASDETVPVAAAHLEVQDQPDVLPGTAAQAAHQVYRGWMYANAPGLHPFEHPIYDVWVIACKTPAPADPATTSATPSL